MTSTPATPTFNRVTDGPVTRGVLLFGFPLVLAMTCHGAFNLVDAWFIGQMANPSVALAAIANCDPILMVATIFANGVSTASVAMISRSRSRAEQLEVRVYSGQSILLSVGISLGFGVVGFLLARPIGIAIGAQGEVLELVTSYLRFMFAGIFTMILMLQLTAILRAVGDSRGPAIVLIVANVLNIVADPFLIDAETILGIEGLPAYGLMGAGYATAGARFLGCLLALWFLMRLRPSVMPTGREWSLDWRIIKKMARIGGPNSLQLVIRVAAIIAMVALVNGAFSTADDASATAAMGIGIRIDMVVLFAAMGWGAAAATYTGQNLGIGRADRASLATWVGVLAAGVMMVIVSVLIWVWAEQVIGWFAPNDTRVIAYGADYLRVIGPSYAFAAGSVVLALALNGAGSTKAPAVIDGVAYLLLLLPIAHLLVHAFDAGTTGVWASIAGVNVALAVGYSLWFARGSWRRIEL